MGRKKSERKIATLRVYEESAEKLLNAAAARRLSMAAFFEQHIDPFVDDMHRKFLASELQRLDKGGG